jgi:hypothetical protein
VGEAALCRLCILCVVPILWDIRASKSKVKFSTTLSVQLLLIHSAGTLKLWAPQTEPCIKQS